jgi:hypothetical protein
MDDEWQKRKEEGNQYLSLASNVQEVIKFLVCGANKHKQRISAHFCHHASDIHAFV